MLSVAIDSFKYAETDVLVDVKFALPAGKHLAILGESGCGKSTLLHLIYGLLHLENGSITWNNSPLLGPQHSLIPGESFMKLVAQEFDVMPFISVSENIATHLTRLDQNEDTLRVNELLIIVDLESERDSMVKQLSGGQKQRVALAKALANMPELLLLDEPFSNIDTFRKNKLRRSLFNYAKEQQISCITATHDSEEALSHADYILLLGKGSVASFGTAEEVYANADTTYKANFFGDVSAIPSGVFGPKPYLLWPHQLVVSEKQSGLAVSVDASYFKGTKYLIQGRQSNGDVVYFNHMEPIPKGMKIKISRK